MSDFSDRPFVAGSLTGLRAFDVDKYGRLVGPTYRSVFTPGENVAKCEASGGGEWLIPRGMAFKMMGLDPAAIPEPRVEKPERKHVVGKVGCSCGFYAYFDGKNDYARTGRVAAIIEGYGVCTVGDRGFRAEKAQLVGLIDNRPLWKWLSSPLVMLMFAAFNAVHFGLIVRHNADVRQVFTLIAAAVCVAAGVIPLLNGHPLYPKRDRLLDKVRRNYPDVPVYRNQRAALRAHPVAVPEGLVPTPDQDDFWTRPVTA